MLLDYSSVVHEISSPGMLVKFFLLYSIYLSCNGLPGKSLHFISFVCFFSVSCLSLSSSLPFPEHVFYVSLLSIGLMLKYTPFIFFALAFQHPTLRGSARALYNQPAISFQPKNRIVRCKKPCIASSAD